MKRSSPEPQRDSAPTKKRSTVPPSPPQSQHGSPESTVQEKIANIQKMIEREINAKFELEYKGDIVKYMNTLEVFLRNFFSRAHILTIPGVDTCFPRYDGPTARVGMVYATFPA